jgi:hypothetical protein
MNDMGSFIIQYLGWQACSRFLGSLVKNGDYLLMPLRNAPNGIPEPWRVYRSRSWPLR